MEYEKICVLELLNHWFTKRKNTLAPSNTTNYASILKQISSSPIGNINLENLTSHDVEEYLLSINKMLAPSTVNLTETLLKSALSFAFNEKFINLIPAWNKVGSSKKPQKRALTVDQRNLFVTYAKTEKIGIALIFQLFSGMRIGEITALRWDDIDFENKILHVRHSTRRENGQSVFCLPKNNKTREIPLHQNLIKLLQRQQEVQKQNKNTKDVSQNKNLVFCSRNGNVLATSYINLVLKKISGKITEHLKSSGDVSNTSDLNITSHILRHTFATCCMEQGIPLKVVSEWLGHASIRTTADIYSHVLPQENEKRSTDFFKGIDLDI